MGELSDILMQLPYLGLFCLLILGNLGCPFPEDAILLSCGFLIARQIVEPVPAVMTVYAGILTGDLLIYSFGRKYGRVLLTHRRLSRILPPDRLDSLEGKFKKFGVPFMILGRQIIGVRSQMILAAGVLRMPLRTFLLTDAFAACVTISIMVSIGYAGTRNILRLSALGVHTKYAVIILLLLAIAFFFIKRFRNPRPSSPSETSLAVEKAH